MTPPDEPIKHLFPQLSATPRISNFRGATYIVL